MRHLTQFDDERQAQALADVLLAAGIDNSIQPSRDGSVGVWVHDEARLNEARALAADFDAAPDAARFAAAGAEAAERRRSQAREAKLAQQRTIKVRERFSSARAVGPVTLALIVASVGVALLTTTPAGFGQLQLGDRIDTVSWLSFQSYAQEGDYVRWLVGLPDLKSGQVWRLFTPIFIHFGIFHILFNMWWLRDLGTFVERRQSSWLLLVMVAVIAGVSNTAQFLVRSSPYFGGMSGVVYGLFAYIWIRGRYDPQSGYAVSKQTVYWMIGFYVLCWTGLIGNIANVAHTAGLVVGAVWGWLAAGGHRRLSSGR